MIDDKVCRHCGECGPHACEGQLKALRQERDELREMYKAAREMNIYYRDESCPARDKIISTFGQRIEMLDWKLQAAMAVVEAARAVYENDDVHTHRGTATVDRDAAVGRTLKAYDKIPMPAPLQAPEAPKP